MFQERLKHARECSGLTLYQLADITKLTRQSLYSYEDTERKISPNIGNFIKIIKALRLRDEEILALLGVNNLHIA